jgi:hypothetical protein
LVNLWSDDLQRREKEESFDLSSSSSTSYTTLHESPASSATSSSYLPLNSEDGNGNKNEKNLYTSPTSRDGEGDSSSYTPLNSDHGSKEKGYTLSAQDCFDLLEGTISSLKKQTLPPDANVFSPACLQMSQMAAASGLLSTQTTMTPSLPPKHHSASSGNGSSSHQQYRNLKRTASNQSTTSSLSDTYSQLDTMWSNYKKTSPLYAANYPYSHLVSSSGGGAGNSTVTSLGASFQSVPNTEEDGRLATKTASPPAPSPSPPPVSSEQAGNLYTPPPTHSKPQPLHTSTSQLSHQNYPTPERPTTGRKTRAILSSPQSSLALDDILSTPYSHRHDDFITSTPHASNLTTKAVTTMEKT